MSDVGSCTVILLPYSNPSGWSRRVDLSGSSKSEEEPPLSKFR